MATGGSGWWDSWVQTAKEKGSSVLEFMKKDIDEFTTSVQTETSAIVNSTAATIRDKLHIEDSESTASVVKRSFSGFLDTVSTAFTIPKEPNDDDEAFVIRNDEPVVLNRLELQLLLLQRDMKTYLVEPSGRPEDYDAWLRDFDLESKQPELNEMMEANSHLRSVYERLVPADLSHSLFWHRYFYRVHQLLEAEKRRQAIKQRADLTDELDLAWDEDDELNSHVLTPQETDRILNEYQRECEERASNGSNGEQSNGAIESACNFDSANKPLSASSDRLVDAVESSDVLVADTRSPLSSIPLAGSDAVGSPASSAIDSQQTSSQPENLRDELSRLPQCDLEPSKVAVDPSNESVDGELISTNEPDSSKNSLPSSKDESLNEDEWEKDFDIDVTDELAKNLTNSFTAESATQEEDWEKWQ